MCQTRVCLVERSHRIFRGSGLIVRNMFWLPDPIIVVSAVFQQSFVVILSVFYDVQFHIYLLFCLSCHKSVTPWGESCCHFLWIIHSFKELLRGWFYVCLGIMYIKNICLTYIAKNNQLNNGSHI